MRYFHGCLRRLRRVRDGYRKLDEKDIAYLKKVTEDGRS